MKLNEIVILKGTSVHPSAWFDVVKRHQDNPTVDTVVELIQFTKLKNYHIKDDMTIDVNGDAELNLLDRTGKFLAVDGKLLVKFGTVTGTFNCSNLDLVSFEGAPHTCNTFYSTRNPRVKDLEHCPQTLNSLVVSYGKLESLKGMPKRIPGNVHLDNNRLTSLEHISEYIGSVCALYKNKIKDFRGIENRIKHLKELQIDSTIRGVHGGLGIMLINGIKGMSFDMNFGWTVENIPPAWAKIYYGVTKESDIFEVQQELIDSGFANLAEI